jgi:hypothetical protein
MHFMVIPKQNVASSTEIRAIVPAPLRDNGYVIGWQMLKFSQILMRRKTLKSTVKKRQSYKLNNKYNNNNNNNNN